MITHQERYQVRSGEKMKDRVSNQEIKIRIYLVFDPFQVYIKNSKETVSR